MEQTMKKIALVMCVLSLLCWAVPLRWAQGQTKLNVIYPAISGVSNALWVAREAHTFAKYRLEVTLLYVPSAPQVVRVMLAGDSPISFTGGAPVGKANLGGGDFGFFGGRGRFGFYRRRGEYARLLLDGDVGYQVYRGP